MNDRESGNVVAIFLFHLDTTYTELFFLFTEPFFYFLICIILSFFFFLRNGKKINLRTFIGPDIPLGTYRTMVCFLILFFFSTFLSVLYILAWVFLPGINPVVYDVAFQVPFSCSFPARLRI